MVSQNLVHFWPHNSKIHLGNGYLFKTGWDKWGILSARRAASHQNYSEVEFQAELENFIHNYRPSLPLFLRGWKVRNLASLIRQNTHLSRPRLRTEQNNWNLRHTLGAAMSPVCPRQIWCRSDPESLVGPAPPQLWKQLAHWELPPSPFPKHKRETLLNHQWLSRTFIVMKSARLVHYESLEAAKLWKSISVKSEMVDSPRFDILKSQYNNSATDSSISLKSDVWARHCLVEVAQWLKSALSACHGSQGGAPP